MMNETETLVVAKEEERETTTTTTTSSPPDQRNLSSSWESLRYLDVGGLLFSGQEPTTIALEVMYSLSFIAGLVGNTMALRVLARKKRNRLAGATATRNLLINLAVCDMMVVCVCMPVTLEHQVYNVWVLGDFMCRAVPFVQAVSVSASVLSLSVISVNRYYTVHSPLNARAFFTWRRIFWMICAVWAVSSGLCAPLIFMNETRLLVLSEAWLSVPVCAESWPYVRLRQGYNFLLFCSLYGFPVLFNLTICLLTGRRLWSDRHGFREAGKRQKARQRIVKMVVALVLLFTLSWLPLYTIDIWIDFHLPNVQEDSEGHAWVLKLRPFAQWLGLTNSTLNPLCYCFIGNLYRSARRVRESYRQRLSAVFHLHSQPQPQAEAGMNSSTPRLLSYRTSKGTSEAGAQRRVSPDRGQALVRCKNNPHGNDCETTFA